MARLLVCSLLLLAGVALAKTNRIYGGEDTSIKEYPSVVQIEFLVGISWVQSCAGSILTSTTVLTSAQCSSGIIFDPRMRRVKAGSSYRGTGGYVSAVQRTTNHPNYGQINTVDQYDISVWRIEPLQYSDVIKQGTIIAYGYNLPVFTRVVKVGWGVTKEGNQPSNVLQVGRALVFNSEICSRILQEQIGVTIRENILCTGDGNNKVSACAGDTGGPVYYENIIVGVISWGHGCGNITGSGAATLNTAVSPFSDWIVVAAS